MLSELCETSKRRFFLKRCVLPKYEKFFNLFSSRVELRGLNSKSIIFSAIATEFLWNYFN